jgi:hypothetical protein
MMGKALAALALVSLAVVAAGCCALLGGGSDKILCVGAADMNGAGVFSVSDNEDKGTAKKTATAGLCGWYCDHNDAEVTRLIEEWHQTDSGKKSNMGRSSEIGLVPGAKAARLKCKLACAGDLKAGKFKDKSQCFQPSKKTCTTKLKYKGKTHKSKADSAHAKHESRRLACTKYCEEDSPAVDHAYQEWKSSRWAKKSKKKSKREALISGRVSDAVFVCRMQCVSDVVLGRAKAKVSCK